MADMTAGIDCGHCADVHIENQVNDIAIIRRQDGGKSTCRFYSDDRVIVLVLHDNGNLNIHHCGEWGHRPLRKAAAGLAHLATHGLPYR